VSFDVVSLFTKVPLEDIMHLLSQHLDEQMHFRWWISASRLPVSQSVLACRTNAVSTACFCAGWWSDLACSYSSIWVDFPYTECPSDPSGLLLTRTSKKGKLPFCSTSIVNLMFGWMLFRCCRKPCSSFLPCGHTTNMSSSYLYYRIGFLVAEFIAYCSK
jgi:hypothetical protein